MAINLILNGDPCEVAENTTISGLLVELDLAEGKVAIERNLEIVPKSAFGKVQIQNDDRIEIVHFIGGG